MTRLTETQYAVSGVGVIEGANLDFKQPLEATCRDCGGMVDLTTIITVNVLNEDGTQSASQMTEANARALLTMLDMAPPPVLCDQHAWIENEVKIPSG